MTTIVLPARCDRAAAQALLPELVAGLGTGPLQIDGSAVEQLGQAMLQVLVSARRTGDGAVIAASPALIQAGRLTGLSDDLFSGQAFGGTAS